MTWRFQNWSTTLIKLSCLLTILLGTTIAAYGQQEQPVAPPHSYSMVPIEEQKSGAGSVLESICWYIPNRIMDICHIPSLYMTLGDTQAASIRVTKYLNGSWVEMNAYCLGWDPRYENKFLVFTEELDENYFGFLAAGKGEIKRDPTEVGMTFHVIAVGINVSVSLGETVDAVLGFLGIDLRGDDHGPFIFEKSEHEDKME